MRTWVLCQGPRHQQLQTGTVVPAVPSPTNGQQNDAEPRPTSPALSFPHTPQRAVSPGAEMPAALGSCERHQTFGINQRLHLPLPDSTYQAGPKCPPNAESLHYYPPAHFKKHRQRQCPTYAKPKALYFSLDRSPSRPRVPALPRQTQPESQHLPFFDI